MILLLFVITPNPINFKIILKILILFWARSEGFLLSSQRKVPLFAPMNAAKF